MPARAKGPRLYLKRRAGRAPVWIIRDTGRPERSTGTSDRGEAEAILSAYLAERDRRDGPRAADAMTVADALDIYGQEHAPHTADPARIGYAISALLPFWAELPVSAVTGATCRRYVKQRSAASSTARRELGTLQAALRYCEAEGHLLGGAPRVTLPPKTPPRDRWLTVSEAARLLRAASPHLRRFILVGLYTGTRRDAILSLAWAPHPAGGYIDTAAGVLYRRGEGQVETRKRQTPVRLPGKLLTHARRWQASGGRWVVQHRGQRVGAIKTAWNAAVRRAGLEDTGVTPHTLRHTAITWAMQRGVSLEDASGFFGITPDELRRTYWHHHPDWQAAAADAMSRRAGHA